MLKRIRLIQNIGEFKQAGNCELGKITLVYGLNGYGKSTFSDICRSCHINNGEIIQQRTTIANGAVLNNQAVSFSYIDGSSPREQEISFRDDGWTKDNFGYDLEVFDSSFIEDNVLKGLSIERANKENLTSLILGESNVSLAKDIAKLKQEQNKINTQLNQSSESIKRTIGHLNLGVTLDVFLALQKPESIDDLNDELRTLQDEKKKIEQATKKSDPILRLPEPLTVDFSHEVVEVVKGVLDSLKKGLKEIDESSIAKFRQHIETNFKASDGSEEEWIRKGLFNYVCTESHDKNVACPFCGQDIKSTNALVNTYRTIFSNEYQSFYKELKQILDKNRNKLQSINSALSSMALHLSNNAVALESYKQYLPDDFSQALDSFRSFSQEVKGRTTSFHELFGGAQKALNSMIEKKLKTPFDEISPGVLKIDEYTTREYELKNALTNYNTQTSGFLEIIKKLKADLRNEVLKFQLKQKSDRLKELYVLTKRHEFDVLITEITTLQLKKEKLETEITQKQNDLVASNDEFAQSYYEDVSSLFQYLGASNFEIEKSFSRRGNQPIYGFGIKFRDRRITDEQIRFFFSDADRRALALSIFFAKLIAKRTNPGGLSNTILILDDPVTSFDDNRISSTIMKIKELMTECRQVVIMSHYREFLRQAFDFVKGSDDPKFLQIQRSLDGSTFVKIDDMNIVLDDYAKALDEIERFVEGESIDSEKIRLKLRTILQKELEWRYRRQLKGVDYDGIGGVVEYLKNNGHIVSDKATKLNGFNVVLRPTHHDVDPNSPEDTRNLAKQVLDFVYKELNH